VHSTIVCDVLAKEKGICEMLRGAVLYLAIEAGTASVLEDKALPFNSIFTNV